MCGKKEQGRDECLKNISYLGEVASFKYAKKCHKTQSSVVLLECRMKKPGDKKMNCEKAQHGGHVEIIK
jgi:hypothetical protein